MSRFVYVNGSYVPHRDAAVHVEDRGYQFGDGVYEVVLLINGKMADCDGHLKRLKRSLRELEMMSPASDAALCQIMARLTRLNRLKTGIIYIQITRGVARRDHAFPKHSLASLVMTVKHVSINIGQRRLLANRQSQFQISVGTDGTLKQYNYYRIVWQNERHQKKGLMKRSWLCLMAQSLRDLLQMYGF